MGNKPFLNFTVGVEAIKNKTKFQTIRRKDRFKVGDKIIITMHGRVAYHARITKKSTVYLERYGMTVFKPEPRNIWDKYELDKFAKKDGFEDWKALVEWMNSNSNYRLPGYFYVFEWEELN